MKKIIYSVSILILTITIGALIIVAKGLYDGNAQLSIKVNNTEQETKRISNSFDSLSREYDVCKELANAKEEEVEDLTKKIEILKTDYLDTQAKNKELEENIERLQGRLENANKLRRVAIYDDIEFASNIAFANTTLIYKKNFISIGQWEKEVKESFGDPIKEKIELNGTGIWYLDENYTKISTYEDMEIGYLGDSKGENYSVVYVSAKTNKVITLSNIRVGDKLDDLLYTYPLLINESGNRDKNNTTYTWEVKEYSGSISFKVVNGIIEEIIISMSYT